MKGRGNALFFVRGRYMVEARFSRPVQPGARRPISSYRNDEEIWSGSEDPQPINGRPSESGGKPCLSPREPRRLDITGTPQSTILGTIMHTAVIAQPLPADCHAI